MLPLLLSLFVPVSAALNVRAELRGERRRVYLFKPLTTTLVLAVALTVPAPVSPGYRGAVAAGLLFSLAGDVLLMLPSDRFAAGLAAFLAAHLCYLAAFGPPTAGATWAAAALLLPGAVLLWTLWPRLGRLRAPVALYAGVLLLMAWQAAAQWDRTGEPRALLAAAGAALFAVSDSALALERFVRRTRYGQALVLGTYFAAQWLIAASVSTRFPWTAEP